MAFDQTTRNRLQKFVSDARTLLSEEFTRQLQNEYGMDPATGEVADLEKLTHLDDARRETARLLRTTLHHYLAAAPSGNIREVMERIVREQAFTVLNRLCALRMAEARGLLIDSINNGYNSKGFQLYARLAGTALGETGDAYRCYIFSLFDEFAIDLPVLFDRYSPMGRLFPRETTLLALLDNINAPDIASLWAEDETIGWIYQYFNSVEERRQMRSESQAPRNSRELAVRNQFFTPRYVVEFLTDNTLGRIWYEMTQGQTALKDSCRYLVRRPHEIFLKKGEEAPDSNLAPEGRHVCSSEKFSESVSSSPVGAACSPDSSDNISSLRDSAENRDDDDLSYTHTAPTELNPDTENLLNQPVYIPFRPLKDPREIRMLDPACGSMHFGLYAFDLFERIYEEVWNLEEGEGQRAKGKRQTEFPPFHDLYASKEEFLRDVPRLIIEYNIHGVDIDPRAVQIAGLSLWLRAQRSWKEQNIKPADRPRITRSNIVCAEPMPGEQDMLREFTETLKPKVRGQLVAIIFEKMEKAGEAGSLLKIEEEIEDAVAEAREDFNKELLRRKEAEQDLFSDMLPPKQTNLFDFADLPDKTRFWNTAVEKILKALKEYAEQAEAGEASRRRLFADDAAKGFAFIDLCRKRFDVVLMNPPFGDLSTSFFQYGAQSYPLTKYDLGTIFIERTTNLLLSGGRCGWITSRTWMALSLLEDFRRKLLYNGAKLSLVADFGIGVLEALVETAACILSADEQLNNDVLVFRLLDSRRKEQDIKNTVSQMTEDVTCVSFDLLKNLPRATFGYWLPYGFVKRFSSLLTLEDSGGVGRQGLATTDDFRFLRALWEVPKKNLGFNQRWVPLAKGGEYEPYYDDIHLVIDYEHDAVVLKTHLVYNKGQKHWSRRIASSEYYGRPGLTYPERTTSDFSPRPLPAGSIFTATGQAIFFDSNTDALVYLGLAYTRVFKILMELFIGGGDASESGSAARHYTSGILNEMPLPHLQTDLRHIANLTKEAIRIRRYHFQQDEVTIDFFRPPLVAQSQALSINDAISRSTTDYLNDTIQLLEIGKKIDQEATSAYYLSEKRLLDEEVCVFPLDYPDSTQQFLENSINITKLIEDVCVRFGYRRSFTKKAYWANRILELLWHREAQRIQLNNKSVITATSRHLANPVFDLHSYLLGLIFGRWDIRYATGEKEPPELPDPFDPLPVCPPGMLQNAEGLPAEPQDVPQDYPLRISWSGILVDDEGHPEDIVTRVRETMEVIWHDKAGDIEQEAYDILGVKSLREYFNKPAKFFADHLKRYSKSRRQAPIYWPLSTPSGSYTLWLYYHRLTDQTLYTCVNDFVELKLRHVTEALNDLRRKTERSQQEEKELEQLADLEVELKIFRNELLRIAKFWKPNLNDGVQITAAPLWKLFLFKPWQKKLKQTWQKLEKGDYDWAHLAYNIWPERVIRASHKDRSYAIAHDLEDDLWEEIETGTDRQGNPKTKWVPRKLSEEELQRIIQDKTG